jgi:hypothetical protein
VWIADVRLAVRDAGSVWLSQYHHYTTSSHLKAAAQAVADTFMAKGVEGMHMNNMPRGLICAGSSQSPVTSVAGQTIQTFRASMPCEKAQCAQGSLSPPAPAAVLPHLKRPRSKEPLQALEDEL